MPYVLDSQMGDTSISLEIASYEFPDNPANELDANWMVVAFTGRTPAGSWSVRQPALLTWEIEDLISWCRGNYRTEPLTQFVEPALQFFAIDIDADRLHMQITLSHELLPAWHREAPLVVDLIVNRKQLSEFADQLEDELSRHPYRYPAHKP